MLSFRVWKLLGCEVGCAVARDGGREVGMELWGYTVVTIVNRSASDGSEEIPSLVSSVLSKRSIAIGWSRCFLSTHR